MHHIFMIVDTTITTAKPGTLHDTPLEATSDRENA